MKLYVFGDIVDYAYAGGIIAVIANSEVQAYDLAILLLEESTQHKQDEVTLSKPTEVDITIGNGVAYTWEL